MDCPGREHSSPLTTQSKKLERVPRNSAAICYTISLLTSSDITHQAAAPLRCSPTCTDVSNGDWPSVLGTVGIRAPIGKVWDFFFLFTGSIDQSVRSIPGKVDFFLLSLSPSLPKRPDRLSDPIDTPTQLVVPRETTIRHK